MLYTTAGGDKLQPYIFLSRKTIPKNAMFPEGATAHAQRKRKHDK
jgi:hypothetical protein